MTDWIGRTFTSDVGWDHLERLVDAGPRMAGTGGEREALAATRDALADVGARGASVETFPIQGWVRGDAGVRAAGTDHPCIALPRSPAGRVSAHLVDVGDGMPGEFAEADVEGAVAMASSDTPAHVDRFVHRREKYYRAVDAGAAAFVFRNHVEGCLAPTGSVGNDENPVGPIPAVGVSREVGARLRRRAAGETVTVAVDCETPDAESGTVTADLGPDTPEAVWLTCHVDAHDVAEGAMDNGAGTATVVEVARALAAREADLETRVHVACFGAEEVGLVGSSVAADRVDPGTVKAVLNVDSNVAGRDLTLHTHGFDGLADAADAVADRTGHPLRAVPRVVPHSDHWPFVARGVPGVMVSAETEGRGRGWGHTAADTLDKLERRTLREQAYLLTELAVELADGDRTVEHRPESEIAAALEREGHAQGMRYTGDWPY
jgi:Zn-dependent M28 family amino/carboxypeptidase